MEKNNIPYEAWPEKNKLLTAFRIKSITMRNPNSMNGLSAVNIGVGLILLFQLYSNGSLSDTSADSRADLWMLYLAMINIVFGVFNLLVTKKVIAWIRDNSSWEERDKHKSSGKHKFQYLLMFVGLLALPYLIACLICC